MKQDHPPLENGKSDAAFARGLARAYGGAIIFSMPMMMTMEMWWLGFYMDPLRLALLVVVLLPVLVALSHLAGFEPTFEWRDDLLDAFVAVAVGFTTAAALLALFGVIDLRMGAHELVGKITIQTIPGSIGALLAQSLLGERKARQTGTRRAERYGQELFLMGIGALFLTLNVAPTEEMILISYKMTEWHGLATVVVSLVIMHAFVYSVQFQGQHELSPGGTPWSAFVRYTLVGYVLGLGISLYALWTFGRTEDVAPEQMLMMILVLGVPAAIGAAAARLIL